MIEAKTLLSTPVVIAYASTKALQVAFEILDASPVRS